jgi:site-specific DNA-methyltransferase (adenine-specific)
MPPDMSAEIILGDCLEVMRSMPDESVDAVITDPPYCSGGFSETGRRQAKGQGLRSETIRDVGWFVNDNMGTAGLVWLLRSVAVGAARLLRDGGSLCLFTDWRMIVNVAPALESSGLRLQNVVVWDKGNAGLGRGFRAQHEMVLHFTKGTGVFHDASTGNVLRIPRVNHATREHQTQKPVELMQRLIRVVAQPNGTVLDPFAGSGTTGVAALLEGRRFIGIEREAAYVEIARRRIAEAQAQSSLPLDAA